MLHPVPVLTATGLQKTYRKNAIATEVLRGLDLEVQSGEFLSVVGISGSGKSTLLHLLGTLDRPDAGAVCFEGKRIDNLPSDRRDRLRNQTFGFIFQFYHLLPELDTLENVLVPQMIAHPVFGWCGRRHRSGTCGRGLSADQHDSSDTGQQRNIVDNGQPECQCQPQRRDDQHRRCGVHGT